MRFPDWVSLPPINRATQQDYRTHRCQQGCERAVFGQATAFAFSNWLNLEQKAPGPPLSLALHRQGGAGQRTSSFPRATSYRMTRRLLGAASDALRTLIWARHVCAVVVASEMNPIHSSLCQPGVLKGRAGNVRAPAES